MRMSKIAGKAFFLHFLYPKERAKTIPKIQRDFQSNKKLLSTVLIPKMMPMNMISAVAVISPTTAGRILSITALTPAYLRRRVKREAISKIMIKEGKTTPRVADSAPKIPPCVEPIKVDILTAIGPGVDSATAISPKTPLRSTSRIADTLPV